jgi:hypothetical protein
MSRDAKPATYKKVAAPSIEKEEFRNTFAPFGQYADQQYEGIEKALRSLSILAPQVSDREPSPPLKGMIRYAIAPWNPIGAGDGWVFYDGTAWTSYTADVEAALTSGLAGKANVSHTHTLADITDEGALAALNTVGTAQIDNNAVTLVKLLDIATASFLGRTSASTGDPEVLTATQATALLNVFTAGLKGLVPSGGSSSTFLRGDATWQAAGGMTLISSGSFSGTQVNIASIPSTYDDLLLECYGVSHNSGSGQTIELAASVNGGSSFVNIDGGTFGVGSFSQSVNLSTPLPLTTENINSSALFHMNISISRYAAALTKQFSGAGIDGIRAAWTAGMIDTTSAINYLRFTLSGGSFDAGSYRLYGIKR